MLRQAEAHREHREVFGEPELWRFAEVAESGWDSRSMAGIGRPAASLRLCQSARSLAHSKSRRSFPAALAMDDQSAYRLQQSKVHRHCKRSSDLNEKAGALFRFWSTKGKRRGHQVIRIGGTP